MNNGVRDAVGLGMPQEYVNEVLRPLIPAERSERSKEMAEQQGLSFEYETDDVGLV